LTDADDEMVLEAAINGRADAIVTHNKRDFVPATERFGIEVLSPAELLERIRRREREP
jgi:predicted nucleic acid-binding protein